MDSTSSSEAPTLLPPLSFAQSPDAEDIGMTDSSAEAGPSTPSDSEAQSSNRRADSRPDSVSSADTVKFPTLPSTESTDAPTSDDAPPSLESSCSSLSTSTSTSEGTTASSLETPGTSILRTASSSSLPNSSNIPSILRTSSSFTLPSRTASGSIVFAPLPNIEPRKRTSTVALGVAARSRLLRHRRMLREQGIDPDEMPPWTDEEVPEDVDREAARRKRHRARHGDMEDDPFGAEDAVAAMSKLFKDTGRLLFRKWSKKQKEKGAGAAESEQEQEATVVVRGETFLESPRDSGEESPEETANEVGGVWEEEVGAGDWTLSKGTADAPEIKVTSPSPPSRRASMLFGTMDVLKKGSGIAGGKAR